MSLCRVEIDGTVTEATDFVAVLTKENGGATISYDTDALTLGMALRLVAVAYVECLEKCTPEEREQIKAILGESYPVNAPEEVSTDE